MNEPVWFICAQTSLLYMLKASRSFACSAFLTKGVKRAAPAAAAEPQAAKLLC